MNFIFSLRKIFLMWVGGWVGRLGFGRPESPPPQPPAPPPTPGSISNGLRWGLQYTVEPTMSVILSCFPSPCPPPYRPLPLQGPERGMTANQRPWYTKGTTARLLPNQDLYTDRVIRHTAVYAFKDEAKTLGLSAVLAALEGDPPRLVGVWAADVTLAAIKDELAEIDLGPGGLVIIIEKVCPSDGLRFGWSCVPAQAVKPALFFWEERGRHSCGCWGETKMATYPFAVLGGKSKRVHSCTIAPAVWGLQSGGKSKCPAV